MARHPGVACKGDPGQRIVGMVLVGLASLPTLWLLAGEIDRPVFAPENIWLWQAWMVLIGVGWAISAIGLRRGVHWAVFLWSQLVLSVLVAAGYIGWYRAEMDYLRMVPEAVAGGDGPPIARVAGLLVILAIWLAVGLLPPLAIRLLAGWLRARRRRPG